MHGVRFHTKSHDSVHQYQNSGVSLVADAMQIASSKDRNPVVGDMIFYGMITEIWILDYTGFKEAVFKCEWVNNNGGVKEDELGFTLVDLERKGHKEDPFILASQAKQVFYVEDPENPKWSCVVGNSHGNYYDTETDVDLTNLAFPANQIQSDGTKDLDDDKDSYVREDGEPLYIDE